MAFIESGKDFDRDQNYEKMKKRMENLEVTQYPLRIPSSLYRKVRIKLASENVKLRALLLKVLEDYIKE